MSTYRIIRLHFDNKFPNKTLQQGLTEAEAKAHCSDPETSSYTCKLPENVAYTDEHGPWFDAFDEEMPLTEEDLRDELGLEDDEDLLEEL